MLVVQQSIRNFIIYLNGGKLEKDLTDAQLCTQLKQLRKETLTLTDSDLNKIRTVPVIYMLEI